MTKHRSFRGQFPYHQDIALVRLSRPAQYNSNVRPVCLPVQSRENLNILGLDSFEDFDASVALILGWGKTSIDDNGRQKVPFEVVDLNSSHLSLFVHLMIGEGQCFHQQAAVCSRAIYLGRQLHLDVARGGEGLTGVCGQGGRRLLQRGLGRATATLRIRRIGQ